MPVYCLAPGTGSGNPSASAISLTLRAGSESIFFASATTVAVILRRGGQPVFAHDRREVARRQTLLPGVEGHFAVHPEVSVERDEKLLENPVLALSAAAAGGSAGSKIGLHDFVADRLPQRRATADRPYRRAPQRYIRRPRPPGCGRRRSAPRSGPAVFRRARCRGFRG